MDRAPDIQAGRLSPEVIADNFDDIAPPLTSMEARVAAERCLFCYEAPCQTACPTGIDIPLFIRQIATGNTIGSAKTILDANIMGAMCARVCPTETLCEEACVREASEGRAVEIGRLQRFATDDLMARGKQLYRRGPASGRRVAIIGAGPAGLACAHKLAVLGHEVTVYEAREKAGGLNEFGIAAYKATHGIAQDEVDYILGVGGITIEYGKRLGRDVTLKGLTDAFDAVFLGMGLGDVNDLGIPADLEGVHDAVDYIAGLRQAEDLATVPVGRSVVVIGGGMTAIDVASQTKRLGARDVTVCYRRGQAQMNASAHEQDLAQSTGVSIRHWVKPVRVIGAQGKLTAVALEYTAERDGKLVGTGETLVLECDQLFMAIGQTLVATDLKDTGIAFEKGRIRVDAERRTSLHGVWAGGDCVAGGLDLTVAAVEDGKQAGISIDRALRAGAKVAAE